jgi:hypothetical protein
MSQPYDEELPFTPYDSGTSSGWAGSDTSHDRAARDDASGRTADRQWTVLRLVDNAGYAGATVKDLRGLLEPLGWHHGQVSSALTLLHMAGRIHRLTVKRDRCHPYVSERLVMGRDTQPPGRTRTGVKARVDALTEAVETVRAQRLPDAGLTGVASFNAGIDKAVGALTRLLGEAGDG